MCGEITAIRFSNVSATDLAPLLCAARCRQTGISTYYQGEAVSTPEEITPENPGQKLRYVLWLWRLARAEYVLAILVSLVICVGRFSFWAQDTSVAWLLWQVLVAPAWVTATILAIFGSYVIKRSPHSLAPELAFWSVFPACSLLVLSLF